MNSKHKNRNNYCLIYSRNLNIKTQIFEFENNFYWKYTLITESWWLQVVDSRGMTLIKLKENFLNSQNNFCNSLIFFSLAANSLQHSWNPLPSSALGGSLWALFIAKAWRLYALDVFHVYAGDKFAFFFFILSHG